MSLIPTIYSSTDPGAPQLSGTVGSLISVLRAVLVNGYGTGETAKPALGWSESYATGSVVCFRNNPASGTGYLLRVDDSMALFAALRGYASMTSTEAGSGPVPTLSQSPGGILWPKSATADSVARAWWIIGNERCFYVFIDAHANDVALASPYFVGDILSLKPADGHCFGISNSPLTGFTGSSSSEQSWLFYRCWPTSTAPAVGTANLYVGRSHTGVGDAVLVNEAGIFGNSTSVLGGWSVVYPLPATGGLIYERPLLLDGIYSPRGYFPGLLSPGHDQPLPDQSLVEDPVGFPTGSVLVAKSYRSNRPNNAAYDGQVLFDATGEWQ